MKRYWKFETRNDPIPNEKVMVIAYPAAEEWETDLSLAPMGTGVNLLFQLDNGYLGVISNPAELSNKVARFAVINLPEAANE